MKVLQTAVSKLGFRDRRGNAIRLEILSTLLVQAEQQGCDLLLLPAGFLQARKAGDVVALGNEVVRRVRAAGAVGVVLGIDAGRWTKSTLEHLVQRGAPLPFWGLAVEPGGAAAHLWPQKTYRSGHGTVKNAVDLAQRTVNFKGAKVLVLLCGEMFNHYMRNDLSGHGLDLVVDAGHSGLGMGLIQTLRAIAKTAKCPAMASQHLASRGGGLHLVQPSGDQASAKVISHMQIDAAGAPWVSAVERTV